MTGKPAARRSLRVERNVRQRMDALDMLRQLPAHYAALAICDPQYRAVLDHLAYGNEGESRQMARAALPAMTDETIALVVGALAIVLRPTGHLILWMDKYTLASGHYLQWFRPPYAFRVVDLIAWNKCRIGMGRRTRGTTEYAVICQKQPTKARGVWSDTRLPDSWSEMSDRSVHPHAKPRVLTERLICATTKRGDLVVDPAAGSYGVLDACLATGREFIGCDLVGEQHGEDPQ